VLRLPADPTQLSMPQLPRELLEISRVKPDADSRSAPIPYKLEAQPAPQQLAEVNPAQSTVRPPTPTAKKLDTSKPLEQPVDTRVDPARLTPVEPDQSLPALEVSETPQKMERAKNAAETSRKMVQASKQVEVQEQAPAVNPAQPASANTQAPTAQQIQVANAPPKKRPVEYDIKLPALEAAPSQEQLPSTQTVQVSVVEQETSIAAAEIARQMAKASDAQAVSPNVEAVDKANPDIAKPPHAILAVKSNATTAAAKSQAIDADIQSTQLSTAPSANPLAQIAIIQGKNVTLEQTQSAAETVQALGQASRNVKINQAAKSADVSKDSPSITSRTVEVAEIAADSTAAMRQTIDSAEEQPRQLASAPARPRLTPPKLPEVETETTQPTISSATHFDIATRGQSVRPAKQSLGLAPQVIVQSIPTLASANFPVGQVAPRQMVAVSSGVPGRSLSHLQPDNKEVEALQLSGVLMEASGGGRVKVMQGGAFQVATSRGAPVTTNLDTIRAGQPLPMIQRVEEPPVKIEVVKVIEQSSAPDVDVTSRSLGDIDDPSATLKLTDIDIPDVPLLEVPRQLINPFVLRDDPKKRMEIIDRLGGSDKTEEAIKRALDWFTENQEDDGHWGGPKAGPVSHDHAATGMAMLAYMGWGAKHTEPGPYQEPLKRAMEWMMKTERNGDLRGSHGHNFMYDHGIAAIAMAEAYSLTKDSKLRPVVKRVVGFTVRAQNPKTGGWRYRPYEENGYRDRGDMSVTGWQIMALKSAQFGGIEVPLESLDKALKYMDGIGGGRRKSIYGYTSKSDPKPAMVSEGMFCHQLLRQHAIDRRSASPQAINLRLGESAKYIEKHLPNPRRLKYNYYYWYYACLALHQQQGPIWERWNARMRPVFLKAQVKRPGQVSLHGSWDPIGEWGSGAGRCIITGMATLSLEVYYRYLPMYTPARAQDANKGK
jgi:hypothetical protein